MLMIKNPDKLNFHSKLLTRNIEFEIVYQRVNDREYLFRILRDGVLDAKLTVMRKGENTNFVFIYFTDANDHYILSKFNLDMDTFRDRGKFIFWITDKFLNNYK
jgi:hypothetical protein